MKYKLNKKNIISFYKNSNKEVLQIVKKIIKNTTYISNKVFFEYLRKNIKYLLSIIGQRKVIYVYIEKNTDYKHKSNYWLYTYLKKYLQSSIKIKIITSKSNLSKLKKDDYIIFIDDCIYSGHQLGSTIALFVDNIKNKLNIKVNLFVLVPFISPEGLQYIKQIFNYNATNNFKLIFTKYIFKLKISNKILTDYEITTINKYYPRVKKIDDSTTNYFNDKYFIYFNHKLADGTSTIPLFYKGVVPNTHNLTILSNYNNDDDYKKLIIYPLINNCSISNINNTCPIPPYKSV